MRSTPRTASGFTLMELVLAIAIVGILSTVAISKSIASDNQARAASAKSLAASIATGSAINNVSLAAGSSSAVAVSDASICNAASLSRFAHAPISSSVSISGSGDCSSGSAAVTCSLSIGGQQADAQVQCARGSQAMASNPGGGSISPTIAPAPDDPFGDSSSVIYEGGQNTTQPYTPPPPPLD